MPKLRCELCFDALQAPSRAPKFYLEKILAKTEVSLRQPLAITRFVCHVTNMTLQHTPRGGSVMCVPRQVALPQGGIMYGDRDNNTCAIPTCDPGGGQTPMRETHLLGI